MRKVTRCLTAAVLALAPLGAAAQDNAQDNTQDNFESWPLLKSTFPVIQRLIEFAASPSWLDAVDAAVDRNL